MLQYTQCFWMEGASGSHLVPPPSHMKADHQVRPDHSAASSKSGGDGWRVHGFSYCGYFSLVSEQDLPHYSL